MNTVTLDDKVIAYHAEFSKMLRNVNAGLFLSQLVYWQGKGRDPEGWIYKTQREWYEETGLGRKAQETARRILKEAGIIKEKLKGIPAKLHFWLDTNKLNECLNEFNKRITTGKKSTKLVCSTGTNKFDQKGQTITENTQIFLDVVEEKEEKVEIKEFKNNLTSCSSATDSYESIEPPAIVPNQEREREYEGLELAQVQEIINCIKNATGYGANKDFITYLLSKWDFDYVYHKIDKVARYSRITESVAGFIIRACQRNYPEPRRKAKSTKVWNTDIKQKKEIGNSYHIHNDSKKKQLIKNLYLS